MAKKVPSTPSPLDVLRNQVKQLKDENKNLRTKAKVAGASPAPNGDAKVMAQLQQANKDLKQNNAKLKKKLEAVQKSTPGTPAPQTPSGLRTPAVGTLSGLATPQVAIDADMNTDTKLIQQMGDLNLGSLLHSRLPRHIDDINPSTFVARHDLVDKQEVLTSLGGEGCSLLGLVDGEPVFMRADVPFTAVMLGVQGSGKSYSSLAMLENLLFQHTPTDPSMPPVVSGHARPTLILHYDRSINSLCEAVSLGMPPAFEGLEARKVTILVSPDNYRMMRAHYEGPADWNVDIQPLLFSFDELDARDLNIIMGLEDSKSFPLYAASLRDRLRQAQRDCGRIPQWMEFVAMIEDMMETELSEGQAQPLKLRMQLLANIVAESEQNAALFSTRDTIDTVLSKGGAVVVDLTNQLLEPHEAGNLFAITIQHFLNIPGGGKTVFLDEAHKYLENEALKSQITILTRQQRHLGCQLIISTQSPATIPTETIELANIVMFHHFNSPTWARLMCGGLAMNVSPEELIEMIHALPVGHAVLFDAGGQYTGETIRVRQRLTTDLGSSKRVGLNNEE